MWGARKTAGLCRSGRELEGKSLSEGNVILRIVLSDVFKNLLWVWRRRGQMQLPKCPSVQVKYLSTLLVSEQRRVITRWAGTAVRKMVLCLSNSSSVAPLDFSCQWEHPRRDCSVYNLRGSRLFTISITYHLSLASAFLLLFSSRTAVLEFICKLSPAVSPVQPQDGPSNSSEGSYRLTERWEDDSVSEMLPVSMRN